ncbi:MAG TPA: FtsX-like permease family protein [Fimbriiglobus sp.]|nr:FtsX-like permease family protein [Fimbriiglobus sp.]
MTAFRLALSNLAHERGRTAVSVVGSAFAVVLVFMQYGFLGALYDTATLLYDRLAFDLMLTSSEYLEFSRPGTMDRARLAQARSVAGVEDVVPLSSETALWRNPTDDPERGGKRWQLAVLGVDPGRLDETFLPPDRGLFGSPAGEAAARAELAQLGTVLLDRRSRPDFGDPTKMPPGTVIEVSGRRIELAGYFELGTGFSFTGMLLTNEETFPTIARQTPGRVSFGLVKVAPGADPAAVAERLRSEMPRDVLVFTRDEINDHERVYWVEKNAIGQFFTFGVSLALLVGAVFIYQMMVADIKKHLPEYATLKAVGYRFGYLFRVVVWQSLILAVAGYAIGLVVSLVLYELTRQVAHLPVRMTGERLALVLALAVGMCVGSALAAVRKLRTADPADLF